MLTAPGQPDHPERCLDLAPALTALPGTATDAKVIPFR